MAVPRSGLCKVTTGWTGDITITVGAVDAATVPRQRESAVSLMLRAFERATQIHGTGWTVAEDGAGKWDFAWTATWSMTTSGTAGSRLGLGAGLSAASSYSSAGDFYLDFWPTHGVGVSGLPGTSSAGEVCGDGAAAHAGRQQTTGLTVTLWDNFAAAWGHENDLSGVFDIWLSGQGNYTRCFIPTWSRRRAGLVTGLMAVDGSAQVVA